MSPDSPSTPAALRPAGHCRLLRLGVLLAMGLLAAGVTGPALTLHRFWIFADTVSILSGLGALWREGHHVLALAMALFSVLFPALKLGCLWLLCARPVPTAALRRRLVWLHELGRWSMLDVFVVALLIVFVKLGPAVEMVPRWGLYAFAGAAVLTLLLAAGLRQTVPRAGPAVQGEPESHPGTEKDGEEQQ